MESPATWSYGFGMKFLLKSSCIESLSLGVGAFGAVLETLEGRAYVE